jgi:hypothetical protein
MKTAHPSQMNPILSDDWVEYPYRLVNPSWDNFVMKDRQMMTRKEAKEKNRALDRDGAGFIWQPIQQARCF